MTKLLREGRDAGDRAAWEPGQQPIEVDQGEPHRRVAAAVGEHKRAPVGHRAAQVDHVGDVPLPLVVGLGEQGLLERPEVQQHGADAVLAHRDHPIGQDEPAGRGLQRRSAVAHLDDLPVPGRLLEGADDVPVGQVGRLGQAGGLPVPTRQGEVATGHGPREQGHPLVLGPVTGGLLAVEGDEVRGVKRGGSYPGPVEGGVGPAVAGGAVRLGEADQPEILESTRFRGSARHDDPLAERGVGMGADRVLRGRQQLQLDHGGGGRPAGEAGPRVRSWPFRVAVAVSSWARSKVSGSASSTYRAEAVSSSARSSSCRTNQAREYAVGTG